MRKRRRTLLLGLAVLVLLAGGVGAALLWPTPNEAEQAATWIPVGTLWDQELELLARPGRRVLLDDEYKLIAVRAQGGRRHFYDVEVMFDARSRHWRYADGSTLSVSRDSTGRYVSSVTITPPPPVHPLTRLRRTVARVLPFVGE